MLRTILKPLSFVPALIMMYIIFSFSAQDGDMSGQLSYQASVKIIETADYVFNANLSYDQIDEWANKIDFITRKLAHMTEYFALAIAVSFPLYVYGLHGILLMFLAGLICVGFACGDEFHQSFIAGRSPSARDVCIDSVGVFFGIIVVRIIGWTGRKTVFKEKVKVKQKKPKKKKKDDGPHLSSITLSNGISITYGKNNLQNDTLTWKLARKSEYWFHTKDFHGSHVLVHSDRLDEETIRTAAMIAAYYSKGRYSSSVPVVYCQIKDLKKIPGAKPGMVQLTSYKTIYIDPDEEYLKSIGLAIS